MSALNYVTKNKNKNNTGSSNTKKTVDIQHTNKIEDFKEKTKLIEKLNNNLNKAQNELKELINKKEPNEQIIELKNYIIKIKEELKKIDKINEIDYLINTGDILFDYYNIIENGNHLNVDLSNEKNNILSYFSKPKDDNKIVIPNGQDKFSLSNKYLEMTDSNYIKENIEKHKENCPYCDSLNREIITLEGIIYCNSCFTIEYIIVDHDRPTYKDPPREISYFSYKRLNHFNEWISQIQGKETTDISDDVYDKILIEIKKQKIYNMADLTTIKIKEILKSLKLSKYYEHCSHIVARINGIQTPQFSYELEDTLRNMFKQIQPLFNKYAPKKRKNFLSYSYVLYKMLQLLSKDEYLKYFPLLKSREKLQSQDTIWECLCRELHWEFIKSI